MGGSFPDTTIEIQGDGPWGVVASIFHRPVVDRLLDGALDAWREAGVPASRVQVVRVPGAWEIPLALEILASRKDKRGLVALGVILRGETTHDRWIAEGVFHSLQSVILRHRIPIGLGVLTCESVAQAEARAGGSSGNRGAEAVKACLAMADLLDQLAP